jgi:hypothetical protein
VRRSELNQREYCELHGLPLKRFGNWRANVVHDGEVGPRSFGRYFSTVDFAISIPSF